jgi:hypothetical protein
MKNGRQEEERRFVDNRSLVGLGLFVLLVLFGVFCAINIMGRSNNNIATIRFIRKFLAPFNQ